MSLGKVAVSFTHTIKASEPFFSVILSAMFLGEVRIICTLLLHYLFICTTIGWIEITLLCYDSLLCVH